jgi:hypothetical protein
MSTVGVSSIFALELKGPKVWIGKNVMKGLHASKGIEARSITSRKFYGAVFLISTCYEETCRSGEGVESGIGDFVG